VPLAPVISQQIAASLVLFVVVSVSVAPSVPSAVRRKNRISSSDASDVSENSGVYPVKVTVPGATANLTQTISSVPAAGEPTLMLCDVAAVVMFVPCRALSTGEIGTGSAYAIDTET
jgi:hypothetical protein